MTKSKTARKAILYGENAAVRMLAEENEQQHESSSNGAYTYDKDKNSFAVGSKTTATGFDQFVFGKNNEENSDSIEIVGSGINKDVYFSKTGIFDFISTIEGRLGCITTASGVPYYIDTTSGLGYAFVNTHKYLHKINKLVRSTYHEPEFFLSESELISAGDRLGFCSVDESTGKISCIFGDSVVSSVEKYMNDKGPADLLRDLPVFSFGKYTEKELNLGGNNNTFIKPIFIGNNVAEAQNNYTIMYGGNITFSCNDPSSDVLWFAWGKEYFKIGCIDYTRKRFYKFSSGSADGKTFKNLSAPATAHTNLFGKLSYNSSSVFRNIRTLDYNGNETLNGSLKIGGALTIGSVTIKESQLQQLLSLL